MDVFLNTVTPPQEEPPGVPEGGNVIINEDALPATAPEGLPVGQDVEVGDSDAGDLAPLQA